jgi:hypothetical protein
LRFLHEPAGSKGKDSGFFVFDAAPSQLFRHIALTLGDSR